MNGGSQAEQPGRECFVMRGGRLARGGIVLGLLFSPLLWGTGTAYAPKAHYTGLTAISYQDIAR